MQQKLALNPVARKSNCAQTCGPAVLPSNVPDNASRLPASDSSRRTPTKCGPNHIDTDPNQSPMEARQSPALPCLNFRP